MCEISKILLLADTVSVLLTLNNKGTVIIKATGET